VNKTIVGLVQPLCFHVLRGIVDVCTIIRRVRAVAVAVVQVSPAAGTVPVVLEVVGPRRDMRSHGELIGLALNLSGHGTSSFTY
jgi:hypothetical protein